MSFFDFYGRAVVMFKLMQMPNKNISSHEMTIANRDFIISAFDFIISSHEKQMNRPSGKLAPRPTPFPKPSHRLLGTTMKAARPTAHRRYMCRKAKKHELQHQYQ